MDPDFPPSCPGCGYDLSAIASSWLVQEPPACPISGTCSECGGGLEWPRVMNPGRWGPRWSFEHSDRPRLRRWAMTSLVSVAPGILWRGLRRGRGIRLERLWVLALSWVVLVHIALTIAAGLWRSGFGLPARVWMDHLPWWIFPYNAEFQVQMATAGSSRLLNAKAGAVLSYLPAAAAPVWLVLLGMLLPSLRLPRRDLLRAGLLSVPTAAIACGLGLAGQIGCTDLERRLTGAAGNPPVGVDLLHVLTLVGYPVFLCFWWREALSRYFGLRRSGWIAVLLGLLIVATIVVATMVYDWLVT